MSLLGRIFKFSCTISDRRRDRGLEISDAVDVEEDILYLDGGDQYNLLDIYKPKGADTTLPVIVIVHGGGYVYGTKKIYRFYAAHLAEKGFGVVNFNYHLSPKTKFPVQLTELNAVMTWLTKNAGSRGLDTRNLFFAGDSAGAQIASHYAAICSNLKYARLFPFTVPRGFTLRAIALNCGIYDFPKKGKLKNEHAIAGLDPAPFVRDYLGRDLKKYGDMIKITANITNEYPPAYIATSEYDFLKAQAKPMYELLASKDIPAAYKLYGKANKKAGHVFHLDFRLAEAKECNDDECAFFKAYINV